jgi:hypothetical protein
MRRNKRKFNALLYFKIMNLMDDLNACEKNKKIQASKEIIERKK